MVLFSSLRLVFPLWRRLHTVDRLSRPLLSSGGCRDDQHLRRRRRRHSPSSHSAMGDDEIEEKNVKRNDLKRFSFTFREDFASLKVFDSLFD